MNPIARRIYLLLEKLGATCSDRILSQNAEDIEIAVRERVCRRHKIKFLGNGIDGYLATVRAFGNNEVGYGNLVAAAIVLNVSLI